MCLGGFSTFPLTASRAAQAAKIIGCKQIIAIDRVEEKLRRAKELGATVLINNEKYPAGLSEAVRTTTNGAGSSITIDTTGALPVIQQALDMTSVLGKMVLLGMSGASIEVDITKFKMVCSLSVYDFKLANTTTN